MISMNLDKIFLEVGEMLKGEINWSSNEQKKLKNINLNVGWRTEGRGDIEQRTIYHESKIRDLPFSFNVEIPLKGPVSYDGKLIRIIWEVWLDIDDGLLFNLNIETKKEIIRVLPRRIEK